VNVTEEKLELEGKLEDMSFEEYVTLQPEIDELEVDPKWYGLFSDATGIPEDRISITMTDVFNFIESPAGETNWSLILKIILAAMIIGLLVFVVFRGMSPVQVTETEPELSVEQLLATTKENQSLDDIEFSEKSETKRMIEKFVDENPDAVANLLRNWLQDEWK
jgi:flagellar M-ring protein FliF